MSPHKRGPKKNKKKKKTFNHLTASAWLSYLDQLKSPNIVEKFLTVKIKSLTNNLNIDKLNIEGTYDIIKSFVILGGIRLQ